MREGIRRAPEELRPVLRLEGTRRQPADDRKGGFPSRDRCAGEGHGAGDRATVDAEGVRAALQNRAYRGRFAARGRGVPGVQFLAGGQLPADGEAGEGEAPVQEITRTAKRSGIAVRGIRSEREAPAREFPAGVFTHCADQYSVRPEPTLLTAGAAGQLSS